MRRWRMGDAVRTGLVVILLAATCNGEMIVTTQDGRKLTLPVNAGEVKRIEYTSGAKAGNRASIGCFKDQGDSTGTSGRDLDGFVLNKKNMTTEMCISTCRDKGFRYAGTQYSTWCFCGSSYGKFGEADNCNMACGGNKKQICGGSWASNVYELE